MGAGESSDMGLNFAGDFDLTGTFFPGDWIKCGKQADLTTSLSKPFQAAVRKPGCRDDISVFHGRSVSTFIGK